MCAASRHDTPCGMLLVCGIGLKVSRVFVASVLQSRTPCCCLQALQQAGIKGAACVVLGAGSGPATDAEADARVLAGVIQVGGLPSRALLSLISHVHSCMLCCQDLIKQRVLAVGISGSSPQNMRDSTRATVTVAACIHNHLVCCAVHAVTHRSRRPSSSCSCHRPLMWLRQSVRQAAAAWPCATSTNSLCSSRACGSSSRRPAAGQQAGWASREQQQARWLC